jgi:hypothetical protein
MRQLNFIPSPAENVEYEARNCISLCLNLSHFNAFDYYIRWVPQVSVRPIPLLQLPRLVPVFRIGKPFTQALFGEVPWVRCSTFSR